MIKGDIVLVKFPFTDLSGKKLRPGLVLCETGNDVIVAFITSELKEQLIGDVAIGKSRQNGLKKDSVLRLMKIATLHKQLIAGKIGELASSELEEVNRGLCEVFKL